MMRKSDHYHTLLDYSYKKHIIKSMKAITGRETKPRLRNLFICSKRSKLRQQGLLPAVPDPHFVTAQRLICRVQFIIDELL
jgi:REP element-mobilizing transposase RayT